MKTKFYLKTVCLFALLFIVSCSKDQFSETEEVLVPEAVGKPVGNEWEDNPYKLNVVYFVPNDMTPVSNYESRIEEIMFDAQEFFAVNLDREGYGRTSFGLNIRKNNGKLNIITVNGQQGKSAYPYSGGGGTVINELEAYFNQHPNEKKSEHTLVFLPSTSGDPLNPGGVPFYGLGKYCFALDYEYFDLQYLGENTNLGDLATKWIGGMVHELGHGLNAPHNKEWSSLQATLGTALMGSGNFSYGKNPTFITASNASIFANSQPFRNDTRSDWYSGVTANITKLKGSVQNNKIVISGNFSSSGTVSAINVWHDPYPAGGNKDYDAPSFTSIPIGSDSLYIESPLSEFYNLDGQYQLRIGFIHENGSRVTRAYEYEFVNGVPNIEVINTKDLLDRSAWSIIEVDSEEDTGAASQMLDGDLSSVWHTEWKSSLPDHPHYFVLDMGVVTSVKGFAFENRSNLNGAIKDFEMFKSDDGSNWTSLGTYSLNQVQNIQYVDLSATQSFRYMKLVTQNSHGDFNYAHLAELNAYSDQ